MESEGSVERPPHMAKPPQQQIIARALEIISDESRWTRGSMARLADSKACGCLNRKLGILGLRDGAARA